MQLSLYQVANVKAVCGSFFSVRRSKKQKHLPNDSSFCQRNCSSLGVQRTGVRAAVPALVPGCMAKSTNTFMNFGYLCQRKMPSPSGGDDRQPVHSWPHLHKTSGSTCITGLCGTGLLCVLTAGRRNRQSKNLENRVFLKMNKDLV